MNHRVGNQFAQIPAVCTSRRVGTLYPQLVLAHVERWQVDVACGLPVGELHDHDVIDFYGESQVPNCIDIVERLVQVE